MMETWRALKARVAEVEMKVMARSLRMRRANGVVSRIEAVGSGNATANDSGNNVIDGGEREETAKDTHDHGHDGPPDDDCCPICFGSFTVACKANCGHWFCGSCILQYWNYFAASKPCKCPMCSSSITKLTPEASLYKQQEQEVTNVLGNISRYNSLFVGGIQGLLQKVLESPLFLKRVFQQMMDPDRADFYFHEMRLFAMALGVLYAATPFNFIPTGGLGAIRLFECAAMVLILVLRLVGIYCRWRLTQRVRHLAAAQPLDD